jgi:hypothetical protein
VIAGAVQETTEDVFRKDEASTPVGASGTVAGVMESDGSEALLVPARFVAVTVNV